MIGTNAVLDGFRAAAGSWIMHAALLCALLFGTTSGVSENERLMENEVLRKNLLIGHGILIVTNLIMNYGDTSSHSAIKFSLFYIGLFLYLLKLAKAAEMVKFQPELAKIELFS